jgi:hypothetical protein
MTQAIPSIESARKINTPEECSAFIKQVIRSNCDSLKKQQIAYEALYAAGRRFITAALRYDKGFDEVAGSVMNNEAYLATASENALKQFTQSDAVRKLIDASVGKAAIRYYRMQENTEPLAASVMLSVIRKSANESGRNQSAAIALLHFPELLREFFTIEGKLPQPRHPRHQPVRRKPTPPLAYDALKQSVDNALENASETPYFSNQLSVSARL